MSTGAKTAMADQEKQPDIVSPNAERNERGRRDRHRRRHGSVPKYLEQSINMGELRELVDLITENGLTQFELEREGFRVKVGRGPTYEQAAAQAALAGAEKQIASGTLPASPSVQSVPSYVPPHPGAQAEEAASVDQDLHIITAPIVGTFYRAPSPTAESFVRIGSQVESSSVVCIIEAMKLMNEIQAETTGEVVKIYVENGQAVEYGQPLFGIKQA